MCHERALREDTWHRQQDYVDKVKRDIGRLKSEARSVEQSTTARQPGLRKLARKKAQREGLIADGQLCRPVGHDALAARLLRPLHL